MNDSARIKAWRKGRFAESLCVFFLRLKGWIILEHGHAGIRGAGVGEIDIIAKRRNTLAFIEVKSRGDKTTALNALTGEQRKRIVRAAETYLRSHSELSTLDIRFDLMVLGSGFVPTHIVDAWRP